MSVDIGEMISQFVEKSPACPQKDHQEANLICLEEESKNFLKLMCRKCREESNGQNEKLFHIQDISQFLKKLFEQIQNNEQFKNQAFLTKEDNQILEKDLQTIIHDFELSIQLLEQEKLRAQQLYDSFKSNYLKKQNNFHIIKQQLNEMLFQNISSQNEVQSQNEFQSYNKIQENFKSFKNCLRIDSKTNYPYIIENSNQNNVFDIEEAKNIAENWKQELEIFKKLFIYSPPMLDKYQTRFPKINTKTLNEQNSQINEKEVTFSLKSKKILQEIQELIENNSAIFFPCNYLFYFNHDLIHDDMRVYSNVTQNDSISKINNTSIGYSLALANPKINQVQRTYFYFKINKGSEWTCIGLANKEKCIVNNMLINTKPKQGLYLIQGNGHIITDEKGDKNGKSFDFKTGDIIFCDFQPFFRLIKFEKIGSNLQITIPISGPNHNLFPCVRLDQLGEDIQILNFYA